MYFGREVSMDNTNKYVFCEQEVFKNASMS